MKRYGFKFYSIKDGTKTRAIDLRYYSVFGGCLFAFSASLFVPGHVGLILVSTPIFLLLGFLSERWGKLFFGVTMSVAIIAMPIVFLFDSEARTSLDWLVGILLTELHFLVYSLIGIYGYRRAR